MPFLGGRPGPTLTINTTATSAASTNGFSAGVTQIRVVANTACHIAIGDSGTTPTATTTTGVYMPANWVEYFIVSPGQKIAAIRAASGGLVTATDGTVLFTEIS